MNKPISHMCSGLFSDALDQMGYRNQVITGLILNQCHLKCFGRARTLQVETVKTLDENIYMGLTFLESLESGQILCVAGSNEFAYFGELMSRLSMRLSLEGVVIGGLTRDSSFTQKFADLPIFSQGYSPVDIKGRGRVASTDTPIWIEGVRICPDDWIFGDNDGIVVIPAQIHKELLSRIEQAIKNEADIVDRINRDESIMEILQHYKEF
ncbi:RraA family protein [Chloroflexota bacterium]